LVDVIDVCVFIRLAEQCQRSFIIIAFEALKTTYEIIVQPEPAAIQPKLKLTAHVLLSRVENMTSYDCYR
jgi:hypothetical protein